MSAIGYTVEGEPRDALEIVGSAARYGLAIARRRGRSPMLSLRVTHYHRPADVRTVMLHLADLERIEAAIAELRERASKETP